MTGYQFLPLFLLCLTTDVGVRGSVVELPDDGAVLEDVDVLAAAANINLPDVSSDEGQSSGDNNDTAPYTPNGDTPTLNHTQYQLLVNMTDSYQTSSTCYYYLPTGSSSTHYCILPQGQWGACAHNRNYFGCVPYCGPYSKNESLCSSIAGCKFYEQHSNPNQTESYCGYQTDTISVFVKWKIWKTNMCAHRKDFKQINTHVHRAFGAMSYDLHVKLHMDEYQLIAKSDQYHNVWKRNNTYCVDYLQSVFQIHLSHNLTAEDVRLSLLPNITYNSTTITPAEFPTLAIIGLGGLGTYPTIISLDIEPTEGAGCSDSCHRGTCIPTVGGCWCNDHHFILHDSCPKYYCSTHSECDYWRNETANNVCSEYICNTKRSRCELINNPTTCTPETVTTHNHTNNSTVGDNVPFLNHSVPTESNLTHNDEHTGFCSQQQCTSGVSECQRQQLREEFGTQLHSHNQFLFYSTSETKLHCHIDGSYYMRCAEYWCQCLDSVGEPYGMQADRSQQLHCQRHHIGHTLLITTIALTSSLFCLVLAAIFILVTMKKYNYIASIKAQKEKAQASAQSSTSSLLHVLNATSDDSLMNCVDEDEYPTWFTHSGSLPRTSDSDEETTPTEHQADLPKTQTLASPVVGCDEWPNSPD